MTSHKISISFLRLGAVFAVSATALGGCSTVKSVSPFGSNVPYAASVQPTIARPAVTEIPAFKPKVEAPPPAPKPAAPVVASPPPAATPAAAPPPPKSSAIEAPAPKVATTVSAPAVAPAAPLPAKAAEPEKVADESAAPAATAESDAGEGPSIPAADRKLSDDGAYPNLAQVPARPVNLPTFTEAAALEKTLVSDRDKAKDAVPASPEAPSVDSSPVPVPVSRSKPRAEAPMAKPVAIAARAEDGSPCLNGNKVNGELAATFHFDPGSSALTAGNLALLAEAVPVMRAAKGAIRIYGHGDADVPAASRFDLAAARAAAVAQAVAGYGIPAPRIAVGVACADTTVAGASVQLYAES